ncbi:MAG: M28 family metallopeptidase [Betaproteobacteria bacterium]
MNKAHVAWLLPLLLVAGCVTGAGNSSRKNFDGRSWWKHIEVLADDNMEGRETGSEGLKRAEAYIASQLAAAGVQPAGTQGYYQPIKFESRTLVEKESSATFIRDGKPEPLVLGEDAILLTRVDDAADVEAPLVFLGYGLGIPEYKHDDFAGIDVRGKIAVIITGSPAEIPASVSSHHQTTAERWKLLRNAGAVGLVSLANPAASNVPWSRIALNRQRPSMDLVGAEFAETAGQKLWMFFNPERAEKLFRNSGHTFGELAALAKDRKALPRFPLPVSIKASTRFERKQLESSNVVAVLPGTDPILKNEYVVLTAHVDHLGIAEPIKGDRIYNGAMDNASGCAVLLDVAASLKGQAQRRSLLFVFVTAEEKGLLGSKYFSTHPTVPIKSMKANINIDMFLPIVPLKMLTVYGLAESDMGDMARDVAASHGVTVRADPQPLRNIFIRSDQYSFVRHGVPALVMGIAPTTPEEEKFVRDWSTKNYHAPSDDLSQPVDLASAGKYEDIIRALMSKVADADTPPAWKADSFFRRYATGS